MQARGGNRPAIGIALEGDIGHRIDVVLGVAMLNGLTAKGEARSIALAVSRPSLKAAQVADVVASFYSNRPGASMIGMPEGPSATSDTPPLGAMLARTGPEGGAAYESSISTVLDTADNAVLIRNMLLAQHDGNAGVVLAGPATGLVRLLDLYGAPPQVEAKVSRLVVALGTFPTGDPDPAIVSDLDAARRLFAEWPSPIVVVGSEVGEALPYPGASIDEGLAWAPVHPVADAYRVFRSMPYDASASTLAAIVQAVFPDEGYFGLSEPGTVTITDDGRTQFVASPDGRHRYVKVDAAQKARVLTMYTELVSAPPAPRPGRRGGPPPPPPARPAAPPAAPKPPAS